MWSRATESQQQVLSEFCCFGQTGSKNAEQEPMAGLGGGGAGLGGGSESRASGIAGFYYLGANFVLFPSIPPAGTCSHHQAAGLQNLCTSYSDRLFQTRNSQRSSLHWSFPHSVMHSCTHTSTHQTVTGSRNIRK